MACRIDLVGREWVFLSILVKNENIVHLSQNNAFFAKEFQKNQNFLKIIKIFQMEISRKNLTSQQEAESEFHYMFVEIKKVSPI